MLEIDKYSRVPIYEQVISGIEEMVLTGVLKEESLTPSVRQLSQELSVNPNTLQKAYMELERRGICFTVPGSGRYIAKGAREIISGQKRKLLDSVRKLCSDLKQSGITKEEVTEVVNEVYGGDNK